MSLEKSMLQTFIRWIPIVGVVAALALLVVATSLYSGDVHWTRVTVSLLCAPSLPDGAPNSGRALPIVALLLLCASMSWLFELIARAADTRRQLTTIQIAGIGSMVYALLTATPMHNLMVNIALAFFLVAIVAIVYMLYRKKRYVLAFAGIACILLKLSSVSLYYTNSYPEIWGVLQKLSFILTAAWLFAVHLIPKRKTSRDVSTRCPEVADHAEVEAIITPETR
jgi:hypothetical protein